MKRIACVACLDPKFSVHAHTFLRAVVLARHGQLVKEAQIRLFDDGGSREGALRAAREIAAWGRTLSSGIMSLPRRRPPRPNTPDTACRCFCPPRLPAI
ncbi:hypothetical protein [Cronobacter sakazakii]|uniref:hypothetical protein n=1 Tax=Cronobacter sakazakii TaxID=28141 RepID=UPI0003AA7A96|nr:hypothetical protein [Cronobacter sakazakii]